VAGEASGGRQPRRGLLVGHMARAERALVGMLRAVDVVWEVRDARCPRASSNPRLLRLAAGKPVVVVLAKDDLAEPSWTAAWAEALEAVGPVVRLDLRRPGAARVLVQATHEAFRRQGRAVPSGAFGAVVAGIPNTGKSTLINRVAGAGRAAVGAQPGVTRGPQWVRLPDGGRVLDLPGVLPARVGSWAVVWRLWAIMAVALDAEGAARAGASLAAWIAARAPEVLGRRYGVAREEAEAGKALEAIARRRGFLGRGGVPDEARAAVALVTDYRRGLLGRLSLEHPRQALPGA
jgi:ribosome biogenesis GTPase A